MKRFGSPRLNPLELNEALRRDLGDNATVLDRIAWLINIRGMSEYEAEEILRDIERSPRLVAC